MDAQYLACNEVRDTGHVCSERLSCVLQHTEIGHTGAAQHAKEMTTAKLIGSENTVRTTPDTLHVHHTHAWLGGITVQS